MPAGRAAFGRAAEIGRLHGWLEDAQTGRRRLAFITGEAGLGKTTLVETVLAGLRADPALAVGCG